MKGEWVKRGLAAGIVATLLVCAGCVVVDFPLREAAGEFTEVVDRAAYAQEPERLAVVNANVLSVDGERMLPQHTVLIDDGRIVAVTPGGLADAGVDASTRVIDGTDLWVIPGLIDTHVHLRHSENDLLLYVANGVTGIAEMSGEDYHLAWRDATRTGALGPNMFIASRKLGNWGVFKGWMQEWTRRRINVGDAEHAPGVLRELREEGFDAVKVGTFADSDTYHAISLAADELDMRMLGHIPLSVGLDDVFASSQQQVAHIEELVKAMSFEFGSFRSSNAKEFLAFVRERAPQVAEKLRANDKTVSTTLWLVDSIPVQKLDVTPLLDDIALAYANPGQVEGNWLVGGWLGENNPYAIAAETSESDREAIRRYWVANAEAHRIVLRALVDEGVRVTAGTDAGNAVVVPGFSLHDELQALVDAGLDNADSLRTATLSAGEWLGDRSGCLREGCRADLLLLEGNPLEDIANTRRIHAVILGGRMLGTNRLAAIRSAVKAANDASRTVAVE